MNADLLEAMRSEGLDGAMLFAWQDEWFKFTWNTVELELPKDRRPLWRNRLTNEENFGVISTEAGESAEETVSLDGASDDWDHRESNFLERLSDRVQGQPTTNREERRYEDFDLSVTHDEAYLYLLLQKREGEWDLSEEELDIGFGTLPDGASAASDEAPGLGFPDGGAQFLLRMKGDEDSRMLVNSAYDQHTWLYAERLNLIPDPDTSQETSAGDFLPWNLALNRGLFLPQTRERVPLEEIEVGKMREGITDPENPEFDNLADWHAEGDVLEIRIPWMLLGFTDPSSHQVWDYPYEAGEFRPVTSEGLRIYPALRPAGDPREQEIEALSYSWEDWEQPASHERKKKGFDTLSEAFRTGKQLEEPRTP